MKRVLAFGRLFLFWPSEAAVASLREQALKDGLALYGLALAGNVLLQWRRPFDFPDPNAAPPEFTQGLGFWLKVTLWQPPLMAALILFCGALRWWMRDGWLPLKMASSALWTALPIILAVAYLRLDLPQAVFAAGFAAWAVPVALAARRVPPQEWRPLAAFLLGLNTVELVALPPEALVTALRSVVGYKAVTAGAGLWMLGCGALGLRRLLPAVALPRALLPLLFALVLQIGVVALAFSLGWLPRETLKALLYG